MKKLQLFTCLFIISLFLIACNQEKELNFSNTNTNKSLEFILDKLSKKANSENKFVKFTLLFNKENNTYGYQSVELVKNSQNILDFVKGAKKATPRETEDKKYQVDCVDSEGNVTSHSCKDYECVGFYVSQCVEAGGCAVVCFTTVIIKPQ
ncbi:MAG: hypothetical protein ACK5H1_04330 [Tenacibaculum sp.]